MTKHRNTKIVRLDPDPTKIVEAIVFVISLAQRRQRPSQYDIVKTIFLADRNHLNMFGRPVTFDNYFAMQHGPVPSFSYNLLKGERREVEAVGGAVPWERHSIPGKRHFLFSVDRDFDADVLSPSDTEHLESAYRIVRDLGFGGVRKLTHEDAAYLEAWDEEGPDNGSYPMSLSMLFESPDIEQADTLAFLSQHR